VYFNNYKTDRQTKHSSAKPHSIIRGLEKLQYQPEIQGHSAFGGILP